MENLWRFPTNGYGQEYGLDTSDMEIFKKDSDGGLAREICQNSNDANNGMNPTKVEFSLFEIDRDKIPGIDELTKQIDNCFEYKKDDQKESKQLLTMKNTINSPKIKCLRISDYNTTGLKGVSTNKRGEPFFDLTKGSGTSSKGSGKGGSKGIGKFATFVASLTNTVFYATKTNCYETGYIGITKLRSVPLEEDNDLMTQGIGYYCRDEKNSPILEDLLLDPNHKRDSDDFGTDIYIIGFNDSDQWRANIVYKIVDSFMVAFLFRGFEVNVGGIIVNKDTLKDIIFDSDLLQHRTERELVGIKAQYDLLTDENVSSKKFVIGEDSEITIYVKSYNSKNENEASRRCEMIRYPYMKIREYRKQTFLPYSALCIIENNTLNKRLRYIENPEHTEWQLDRLKNEKEEGKITRRLYNQLFDTISDYISEVLKQIVGDTTDFEGASEYLPSFDEEGEDGESVAINESVTITPIKKNEVNNPKTEKVGEEGSGLEFGKGAIEGDEDGIQGMSESNPIPNPNPFPHPGPDDEKKGSSTGDEIVLKKVSLSGMRFKYISTKQEGSYDIIFTSLYDEKECELSVNMLGESNDKYDVFINTAVMNGKECDVVNGKIKNFSIEKGKNYTISLTTSEKERFSAEVVLNAYR